MPVPKPIDDVVLSAFRRVLPRLEIDADTNFFAAGGDSLRALQRISFVELELEARLPIDLILRCPTPGDMASAIRDLVVSDSDAPDPDTNAASPPLTVIVAPTLDGTPWLSAVTAEAAAHRLPLFVCERPDVQWPRGRLAFDEVVAHSVIAIKNDHPRGPYVLFGGATDAAVAFEMAIRLIRDEQEVLRLALVDPIAPAPAPLAGWRGRVVSLTSAVDESRARWYRPSAVLPGPIEIYASRPATRLRRWRRFTRSPVCIQPLDLGVAHAIRATLATLQPS
jgi:acyl carrier protein